MKKGLFNLALMLLSATALVSCSEEKKENSPKAENLHNAKVLEEHFEDTDKFLSWYQSLKQEDKNIVLAGTVALCYPELTEIALNNRGNINTNITTYEMGKDHYIYARMRPDDDFENEKAAMEIWNDKIIPGLCCNYLYDKAFNMPLLPYGIVSCAQKNKTAEMAKVLIQNSASLVAKTEKYGKAAEDEIALVANKPFSKAQKKDEKAKVLELNSSRTQHLKYRISGEKWDEEGHLMSTSPLYAALNVYDVPTVKYLLEQGVSAQDELQTLLELMYIVRHKKLPKLEEYLQKDYGESFIESKKAEYEHAKEKYAKYKEILDIFMPYLQNKKLSSDSATTIYLYRKYYLKDDPDIVAKLNTFDVVPDYTSNAMAQALLDVEKINYNDLLKEIAEQDETDINVMNEYGRTALMEAAWEHNIQKIEYLLKYGADVNIKNEDGSTALLYSLRRGYMPQNIKIIKLLLQHGADANAQDKYVTCLMSAIYDQDGLELQLAELLLKYGADVNQKNYEGQTALFKVFMGTEDKKQIDIIKLLLQHGADVNIKDRYGQTPLFAAVLSQNDDSIKGIDMLLAAGADINAKDNEGQTPLIGMFSRKTGYWSSKYWKTIPWLIEHGAEVNAQDNKGKTLLFYAVKSSNLPANDIILLLEYGVDESIKDNEGNTAFDNCQDEVEWINHHKVSYYDLSTIDDISFGYFPPSYEDTVEFLREVIKRQRYDILKHYMDGGLNVYAYIYPNAPLLYDLIEQDNLQCLEKILNKGTDLNQVMVANKDFNKAYVTTPLRLAETKEKIKALLVENGAKEETRDVAKRIERANQIGQDMEDIKLEWEKLVNNKDAYEKKIPELRVRMKAVKAEVLNMLDQKDLLDWEKKAYQFDKHLIVHQECWKEILKGIRKEIEK